MSFNVWNKEGRQLFLSHYIFKVEVAHRPQYLDNKSFVGCD